MIRRAVVVASAVALALAACSDSGGERCDDREDNDSNGLTDCDDPVCSGRICGPNGLACAPVNGTCSACSGNGGAVEAFGEATCGDGADNDCDGAADCADSECQGHLCDALGHTCSVPDAAGHSTCGGVAGGGGSTGTIGTFRVAQVEHQVLGALGSGYHEQSLVTFEVLGVDGAPLAGLRVTFSHESQWGSFIGAVARCSGTYPLEPVCDADGTTDAEGHVGVLLHSGRHFAALTIRAEATAAGVTRELEVGGFTVVGAKPTGARFSLDCRPYNVPAMTVHDCLYSRYNGVARFVTCTATMGDRHGNTVAVPTLVSFQTEAGLITPAALSPPFNVDEDGRGVGDALGVLDVYGGPLPFDVAPKPGEASNAWDFGCGPRIANPRDGLVTVIALVAGEEGFVDDDLDGQYDPGEPFVDQGEPFLDVDDDGSRDPDDPDEWFYDVDQDGLYDGPNGVWDANTVLWTQARVLYTGYPEHGHDASGWELFTRVHDPSGVGTPPAPTEPVPPFTVFAGPPPSTEIYSVFFTDAFLNPMSSFTTFGAEALAGNVEAELSQPGHTADSLATSFRFLYCDPDEPNVCHDGPADAGCRALLSEGRGPACVVRPEIGTTFLYGNPARLSIRGKTPGEDIVQIRATIENVSSVFGFPGRCLP